MNGKKVFNIQKKIFDDLNKKPSVIFDIGANEGKIAEQYHLFFPDAKIFCFEPVPNSFQTLKKFQAKEEKIFCYPYAIGNEEKFVSIFETSDNRNSSLLKPTDYVTKSIDSVMADSVKITNTHQIKQITLDSFCKENNITHIDILKIDTQGTELNVLKGILSLLEKQKVGLIFTELDFADIYENQCYYHEVASFLHDNNYKLFDLVYLAKGLDKKIHYGDAIFLNSEFMKNYKIYPGTEYSIEDLLEQKDEMLKEKDEEIKTLETLLDYEKERAEAVYDSKTWKLGQYVTKKTGGSILGTIIEKIVGRIVLGEEKKIKAINREKFAKELDLILKEHSDVKGIILYPPTVDWNIPLFQRPQHLALHMAENNWLFFYCSDHIYDKVRGFNKLEKNLYLTNQFELLNESLKNFVFLLMSTNQSLTFKQIDSFSDNACVVYDYIDAIDPAVSMNPRNIIRRHKSIIEKSDIVLATADTLFSEVKKLRSDDVFMLPNGVDYSHFHIEKNPKSMPNVIKKIKAKSNPIIGYYGALSTGTDYELIRYCAIKRPDLEFVLIGWDYDQSFSKSDLTKVENIHYLGIIPYLRLPSYAIWFDVCLLPFKINKVTQSTNPIKMFEYMALGKPIVSTNINEAKKYKSVLIAKDNDEFLKKIDEALELRNDEKYRSLLDKEARENTWKERFDKLDNLLEDYISKKNWKPSLQIQDEE